jgi:hypothetical protein
MIKVFEVIHLSYVCNRMKLPKPFPLFFLNPILLFFFFFLFSTSSLAATYYVDAANGNDLNNGTSQAKPWKTIAKVNASRFYPGDQILFKAGEVCREQLIVPSSGSSGNPITFGAYGTGAKPILSGANIIAGWQAETQYIWKVEGIGVEPKVLMFDNQLGRKRASLAELTAPFDWCWSSNTLYVYCTSNPNTTYVRPGITASQRYYSICLSNKNYIHFMDLDLRTTNRSGIRAAGYSDNLDLTNVDSRYNSQSGFEFDRSANVVLRGCNGDYSGKLDGYMFKSECANIEIIDSNASYNYRRGLQADSGVGGFIKITGGEYHHQYSGNEADGIAIDKNDRITIEKVHCHHNSDGLKQGDGIQISGGCINPIIRYCWLHDNFNSGLILNGPNGGSITYNIIYGSAVNGIAIEGNSVNPLNIYNNTIYNTGYGLNFFGISPSAIVNVKNNIFYGASDIKRAIYIQNGLNDANIRSDYNCFWGDNNNYLIECAGCLYSRNSFSSYQINTGKDANSIAQNPKFVNASKGNFSLQATSPCIDTGSGVGLPRDFLGTPIPQGDRVDIGGLEFISAPLSPPLPKSSQIIRR